MSRIPFSIDLNEVQESFRELWKAVDNKTTVKNSAGRSLQITTVGSSGSGTTDYLAIWKNGTIGILGDSIISESTGTVTTDGNATVNSNTNLLGPVGIANSYLNGPSYSGVITQGDTAATGYVLVKQDVVITNQANELRGYQATHRVTRTTADANIGGLGWDTEGFNSAISFENLNMPADATFRGQQKNFQAELYFNAKAAGTDYIVNDAYNYLASLTKVSSSSTVVKWSGFTVQTPGAFGGVASKVTTGYGVWIQNLDDGSHSLVQGNAAAIKIDGLNEYGRISWTGSNIMEPSSGILQLYGSTRVQTPAGTGLYVGGASADSGVNAGSYSISGRLLIDDTATDLGTPTTILTVDPSNGGYVRFRRGTVGTEDAGTPSAGFVSLYAKNSAGIAALFYTQSDGTIVGPLGAAGGGSITGSGTTNQMTKWTGATALGDSLLKDDGGGALLATGSGTHFDTGTASGAGYYVGGTQLIDQAKNIANVVNITASGNIAGGTGNHNVSAGQGASGGFFLEGTQVIRWVSGSHIETLGGVKVSGSENGYSRELTFNLGTVNDTGAITTRGGGTGGSPVMYFDHINTSNTGSWAWRNNGIATTRATLTSGGLFNAQSGFQVNGTTVIDSSRNLTNIGTVSCGSITSSGFVDSATGTSNGFTIASGSFAFKNASAQFCINGAGGGVFVKNTSGTYQGIDTGSYSLSGTQVMDGSRNLTNIVAITTSGTANLKDLTINGTALINSSARWILPFVNSGGGTHIDASGNMFGATIQCTVNFKTSDGSTGATFGPSAVTSITVKNGIVTAIS